MERLGIHRSVDPHGALPQRARRLDATSPVGPDEIAIEVEYLNVDSASWRQIRESTDGSAEAMAARVLDIVRERGKLHNPVTGSGGMLVGRVAELGSHRTGPPVGSRIVTLVSLTLTPLVIDEITAIDPASERVGVKGRATLFGSGIYTLVPEDLDDAVVLGVLDVCGAPAWAARLARRGMSVVVIGAGGKSGMLTCAQAVRSVRGRGRVLGLCWPEDTVVAAKEAGAEALAVDCTDAVAVMSSVTEAFSGEMADLVFVCANVPGCEGGAILACKDDGRVVFFSMATSFSAAALTAEGLGKSCELTIGNGFVPGHADLALDLVRSNHQLLARFGS
jgi:L-erythro-3,5-diaminohexanoate dehydrogenase